MNIPRTVAYLALPALVIGGGCTSGNQGAEAVNCSTHIEEAINSYTIGEMTLQSIQCEIDEKNSVPQAEIKIFTVSEILNSISFNSDLDSIINQLNISLTISSLPSNTEIAISEHAFIILGGINQATAQTILSHIENIFITFPELTTTYLLHIRIKQGDSLNGLTINNFSGICFSVSGHNATTRIPGDVDINLYPDAVGLIAAHEIIHALFIHMPLGLAELITRGYEQNSGSETLTQKNISLLFGQGNFNGISPFGNPEDPKLTRFGYSMGELITFAENNYDIYLLNVLFELNRFYSIDPDSNSGSQLESLLSSLAPNPCSNRSNFVEILNNLLLEQNTELTFEMLMHNYFISELLDKIADNPNIPTLEPSTVTINVQALSYSVFKLGENVANVDIISIDNHPSMQYSIVENGSTRYLVLTIGVDESKEQISYEGIPYGDNQIQILASTGEN